MQFSHFQGFPYISVFNYHCAQLTSKQDDIYPRIFRTSKKKKKDCVYEQCGIEVLEMCIINVRSLVNYPLRCLFFLCSLHYCCTVSYNLLKNLRNIVTSHLCHLV